MTSREHPGRLDVMSRKRSRKQARRAAQRTGADRWATPGFDPEPDAFDADDMVTMWPLMARESLTVGVERACGGCREFVEDQEGGRGTCLHPASGVLSPWTDTPSCAFWARR